MRLQKVRGIGAAGLRLILSLLLLTLFLTSCSVITAEFQNPSPTPPAAPSSTAPGAAPAELHTAINPAEACPLTKPVWAKPPEDSAVQSPPAFGYYFVNEDRSIWASAWWEEKEEDKLQVSKDGVKIGWFRPEGATLEITGERIDAPASPLETNIPCCYPTRFQSSGLYFPTEGCWQVNAKAADSTLTFIVWVEPE